MRAGQLDRLLELRHVVRERDDSSGQEVETWPTAYAKVWAQKGDERAREFFAAQQITAAVTAAFKIRHRTDVLMTDRIVYEDLSYNIHSIAEIGRREGLWIFATATRP
jgi:SPP1 family predicted phage head-tail adaptor